MEDSGSNNETMAVAASAKKQASHSSKLLFGTLFFIIAFASLASAVSTSTVTRSFSTAAPAPGEILTVELDVNVNSPDSFYVIQELIPAGWVVVDAGGGYSPEPGNITWEIQTDGSSAFFWYSLEVPLDASGQYNFSGVYNFDDLVAHDILGSNAVIISGTSVSSVTRSISDLNPLPCSEITVALDVVSSPSETYYLIFEYVPEGLTILDAGIGELQPNSIMWQSDLPASTILEYTVSVPCDAAAQQYAFSGNHYFDSGIFSDNFGDSVIYAGELPSITPIPQQDISLGQAVGFTASATNPNAGTLAWSLDAGAPAGAAIDAMTGAFSWTPSEAGTFNFNVFVDDGVAPQVSWTVTVVVSACQSSADTDGSNTISMAELLAHIGKWKQGTVTMQDLLMAIGFWKSGAGC